MKASKRDLNKRKLVELNIRAIFWKLGVLIEDQFLILLQDKDKVKEKMSSPLTIFMTGYTYKKLSILSST